MNWLLGGLCGLTSRRRRQPRGGAARVESAFSTKGEVPTERGRCRHAMAVGALAPPDAARVAKLGSQQCTQTPRNGAERPDPPICVHYCDPKATHNPSPRSNSVHKRPKTALRGHSRRSVYTPASPRPSATAPQPNSVHKRPNPARRDPILPFVYTIAIPRPPTTQAHGARVYTNALKRLRGAIFADLCTLLRPHNRTRDRVGPLVPRRRRPHGPRDARALGPEAPAAKAVAQPPTHTNSRSLSYKVCIMCHGQLTGDIDRLIWRKENGAERKPDHMKQPAPMAPNGFKLPVQRVTLADGNCA